MSTLRTELFSFDSLVEAVTILLVTCLSFFVFVSVMFYVFPIGAGFDKSVFALPVQALLPEHEPKPEFNLVKQNDPAKAQTPEAAYTALLNNTKNNVRHKLKGGVTWKVANKGQKLFNGDSIQTGAKSSAIVEFDEQNFLNIGQKSLVVIRRLEKDVILPEKQSVVVISHGEIWGRIKKKDKSSAYVEVVTPDITARIKGRQVDETEFKINVEEGKKSSVVVFDGEVEVSDGKQNIVVAKSQQLTAISGSTSSPKIEKLLEKVQIHSPENNRKVFFQDLAPIVKFAWKPQTNVNDYRLIIATDPNFFNTEMDILTTKTEFSHGNLQSGIYYWRVFSKRDDKYSEASETFKLNLVNDTTPPLLKVQFNDVVTSDGRYSISGTAEIGSLVFIDGKQIATDKQGKFVYSMRLKPGINQIVVEAMDEARNSSYKTHNISYR
ncbi:MAG: FecR family protein [Gammaproteobacteria bacterium]|nr:FecR family protein [Gammaproteobacteria bacterium]